jgi:hypothetical protein
MANRIQYQSNKSAKVGTECKCASCGMICKDAYWNTIDPKKRNNTTRISPASKRWLDKH